MEQLSSSTGRRSSNSENVNFAQDAGFHFAGQAVMQPQQNQTQCYWSNVPRYEPTIGFDVTRPASGYLVFEENINDRQYTLDGYLYYPVFDGPPTPNAGYTYGTYENTGYRLSVGDGLHMNNERIRRYATEEGPWNGHSQNLRDPLENPRFHIRSMTEYNRSEQCLGQSSSQQEIPQDVRVAAMPETWVNYFIPIEQPTQLSHQAQIPASHPVEQRQESQSFDTSSVEEQYQVSQSCYSHGQSDGYHDIVTTPEYSPLSVPQSTALGQTLDLPRCDLTSSQGPGLGSGSDPKTTIFNCGQTLDGLSTEHYSSFGQQIPQSAYVCKRSKQERMTDRIYETAPHGSYRGSELQGSSSHDHVSNQGNISLDEGSISQLEQVQGDFPIPLANPFLRRESTSESCLISEPNSGVGGSFSVLDTSMQPVNRRRTRHLSPGTRRHAKEVRRRGACRDCRRKKCKVLSI